MLFAVDRIDRFAFALGVNGFVGGGPDRSAELLAGEVSAQKGAFIRRP